MYPTFAKEAEEEGNIEAVRLFEQIGKVEAQHRDRYKKLLERLENGTLYKRDEPIRWKCSKCGYIIEGTEPPPKCPACQHPKEYFVSDNLSL
jgi:rubrerythrin